ncbi:MAG: lysine--tRNA ligase [Patescibacteria group bacterium]|nr:lysine--tRNA ligase [Patescibacteria group bacterium]
MQSELRQNRIKKLEEIKNLGINPYPAKAERTNTCQEVIDSFDKLKDQKNIIVGRIFLFRPFGKATFAQLGDESARLQIYFKEETLGKEQYNLVKKLDIGDFIQVSGTLFLTKTNEKTLQVSEIKLLTKSILPLPEKFHGLKNEEERYRKRYLDLISNRETFELFKKRTQFVNSIRNFMQDSGFMEVETPVLEHIPGGADATPFVTHHNSLDIDLYLRISLELHLKRLIVGGYEKIFEIGKVFRNEGISTQHLQEFTLLEYYWAYANWEDLIGFIENFYTKIINDTFGTLKIKYKDQVLDFTAPWKQYDYTELIKEKTGIDLNKANTFEKLIEEIRAKKIDVENVIGYGRLVDNLYKKTVRPSLIQPCFLINQPVAISPLAKKNEENQNTTQRLQVLIAGSELGNGFSELNDPLDQRQRFEEQAKLRKEGDAEAQMMDEDFVESLEYGMPPTAGFGVGIDRLFAILTNSENIRDVIFFPLMRPEKKSEEIKFKPSKSLEIEEVKELDSVIDRKTAWELLKQNIKTENLIKHCLASESIMKALAKKLNKPEQAWGITGLVHDLDFDYTKDKPEKHTLMTAEILEEYDLPEDMIDAIKSHNYENTGITKKTDLDFALSASEQLSGLIVSAALVLPDKKLAFLKPESVVKKMKEKSFARNINRQDIQDIEKLGISLDEFVALAVKAMQEINNDLGL